MGDGCDLKLEPGSTVRQEALIARLRDVAALDERILGVEVAGSLEKGTGDFFSDVDAGIRVRDADYAEMARHKRAFFEQLGPMMAYVDAYHDEHFSTCACLYPDLVCADLWLVRETHKPPAPAPVDVDGAAEAITTAFVASVRAARDALQRNYLWLARDIVENDARFHFFRLLHLIEDPATPVWPGRRIEPVLQRLGIERLMEGAACTYSSVSISNACEILESVFKMTLHSYRPAVPFPAFVDTSRGCISRRTEAVGKSLIEAAHSFWYETANNIRFAARGELWFARFNHETSVMESLFGLIAHATAADCQWCAKGHYSTMETIEVLSLDVQERLVKLCVPYGIEHFWDTMQRAAAWFQDLAEETGLCSDPDYPGTCPVVVPKYARELANQTYHRRKKIDGAF